MTLIYSSAIILGVAFLWQTPVCIAAESKKSAVREVPTSEAPQLSIGEGLSDKIYQRSTQTITGKESSPFSFYSAVKVIFPSQFVLKNDYFKVNYADNVSTLLGVSVGPQLQLLNFGDSKLSSFIHFGYYYAQGIFDAESDSGLIVKDAVELQWIPIQGGLEITSRPFTAYNILASFSTSVGSDWISQTGKLDGMNQAYLIPRFEVGPSITVLGTAGSADSGFNGVTVSAHKYSSFSSEQQNRGWIADMGAKYAF